MARRAPFTLDIERLSHEGRGIGRRDGKTVFVSGALPGETAVARTTRRRRSFDEAIAEEILTASPRRVAPPCPHALICGGCSLQHMSTAQQLQHKESVLVELLQHHAGVVPREVIPALCGPTAGYRCKARLGVKYVAKKGGALVGFREKTTSYIADIESCMVLHPTVGQALFALRKLVNHLTIREAVPQIEVAIGDDASALVVRHLKPLPNEDLETLAAFQARTQLAVYLQPEGVSSVHPLNAETKALYYDVEGVRIAFHPTDFTQVNPAINRAMVARVVEEFALQSRDRVLDLFCGIGNFSLAIAPKVAAVVGYEGDAELVARAASNATSNDIDNACFHAANLATPEAVSKIALDGITKVLLDPPRSGAETIVSELKLGDVEQVIYVSCNPVTLARDAKRLIEHGNFELSKAGIMDMFPHTAHVESLAVFTRR